MTSLLFLLIMLVGADKEMRQAPGYAFMTSDIAKNSITKYDADGKVVWSYDNKVSPIDVWAMDDGSLLVAYLPSKLTGKKGGVRRVDQNKKIIFDLPVDDEIMSVQPLKNGNFLIAECHKGKITEMDSKGNRISSFSVATRPQGHKTMRQIRLTSKGTIICAECYSHKLREYNREGKMLREIDLRYVYYPVPLENGHILAGCWNYPEAQVVEINTEGKIIWSVKASDLPAEMKVTHIAGVERLDNGNTLVSASCVPGKKVGNTKPSRRKKKEQETADTPKAEAGTSRVVLFEITPEKEVVWQMVDADSSTWLTTVKVLPN